MNNKTLTFIKNRPLLILILFYVVFLPLLMLFFILLWGGKQTKNIRSKPGTEITNYPTASQSTKITPPPTYPPIDTSVQHKHLSVLSTTPTNNEAGVSPDLSSISVNFDQTVSVSDVPFAIAPNIFYNVTSTGNTLIITPKQKLTDGETYNIVLRLYGENNSVNLYSFKFTILGPTPTLQPNQDSGPQLENQQRVNDPDIYLSNQTPYSAGTFSVTSNYTFTPTGHFYFTVTLVGNTSGAKTDFNKWLLSLGLTDIQIQSLDIRYK